MALTDPSLRKGRAVFIALVVWVLLTFLGLMCMSWAGELKTKWTSVVPKVGLFLWMAELTWSGSAWGIRLLLAWMGLMLALSGFFTAMGTMTLGMLFGTPVGLSMLGMFVVSATFMLLVLVYTPLREFIGHQQEKRLRAEAGS